MRRQTPTGFDDKAEVQEFVLTALKPTLLVADWNVLKVEICPRNRVMSRLQIKCTVFRGRNFDDCGAHRYRIYCQRRPSGGMRNSVRHAAIW